MSGAHNLHVPISSELHQRLREEAHRSGRPATAIARDAIATHLDTVRRAVRSAAIRTFAEAHAGGEFDIDASLEQAGLEALAPVRE